MKTHKSPKTKKLVYEFDEQRLTGTYYPAPDCAFQALCSSATFKGFPKLPKGFSSDGFGFANPAGSFLTRALRETFGDKNHLLITRTGPSKAKRLTRGWSLTINHSDYLRILDPLRDIRHERNLKSNSHVAHILGQLFPRKFKKAKAVPTVYSYEEDKISKMFAGVESGHKRLSKADIEAVTKLYSALSSEQKVDFSSIAVAEESKVRNERIYLQSVIGEFHRRLASGIYSEADWQRFLQKYILLFNTSYVNTIEKLSVDLRGKYPDFLLVNVYGYLDIYEIKKPGTNLLKHDDGRDNYYWDSEVSKAISQTEKYIQQLIKNDLEVRSIVKEKYGFDVKAVRPRGFIVVGNSKQLENSKMNDDFRLLAASLKNVDIILYDELLTGLENLLGRLKKRKTKSTSARKGTTN